MPAFKQILVIDDEKELAELVAESVASIEGRKVFNASNPTEAYMRSIVQRFDLIISDYRMPKTNGADLVKVIRSQKLNAHVPVIMISGYPEEVLAEMSKVHGVYILPKPFSMEELLKVVDEQLSYKAPKESKRPQFDLDVLNEFMNAANSTICTLTGLQDIKIDKPFLYGKENSLEVDVSSLITLQTGKFRGILALCFPEVTFLKLVNGLTKGDHKEINAENRPHVGEVISLIYNQAKAALEKQGISINEGAPQIITERAHRLNGFDGHVTLVIPIHAFIGDFFLIASAA